MPDETAYPVLRNAPIVEAIAYFRFVTPVSEEILRLFREHIREDFPVDDTSDTSDANEKRFVSVSDDRKRFVRVGANDFAYHKLAPYGNGNDFRTELRILWERFRAIETGAELQSIALRAINRIETSESADDGVDNSEYFRTFPTLGDGIAENLFSSFMRIGVVHPDDEAIKGIINWAAQPSTDSISKVAFILDIETARFINPPFEESTLWNEMERLRTFRNRIFFQSITDKTRKMYE